MRATQRILAILVAAAFLGACAQKAEEAAVAAASGGKVQKDGDQVTIETEGGKAVINSGEGQAIPDTFPKDTYIPPEYTVQMTMDMGGQQHLQLIVPGSAADAAAAAAKAMPGMGWKQTVATNMEGSHMLVFEKDGRFAQYNFTADPDGKGTAMGVSIAQQQQ